MSALNLSAIAVRERSVTLFLMLAIFVAGVVAFLTLGRAEDPAFTIKQMTVVTAWPGATAKEMEELVAEPLEKRLQELRWLYDRRSVEEARRDLAAWIAKWEARYPRLVAWAEETIEETFTFYRLPRQHHKHLKSTNMLERLNEEIRRRTYVVRIFPNAASCCRLVRALAVETHENWLEANRYLNMDDLKEMNKTQLREAV